LIYQKISTTLLQRHCHNKYNNRYKLPHHFQVYHRHQRNMDKNIRIY
uniref:Ovule protein n=1 Tax=Haemonchus placei TaxID=6290 RepID=A0A0N4W029_HAEPC